LAALLDLLQYNFFREIAATLPFYELDCSMKKNPTELEALQPQVKEL